MEGNGPASPDLRDIGLIMASDNWVAMDAVVAGMMGLDPSQLRFLEQAMGMGLGDFRLDSIDILGDFFQVPDFKVPPLGGEALMHNDALQDMIHTKAGLIPVADPALCTACGGCIEHCPISALSMAGSDVPEVDADTCITCFCCQEICPEMAMTLQAQAA